MKILALTTHAWNCETWWRSLKSIGHQVFVERYDNRQHHLHSDIIRLAKVYKPDYIVFAGAVEEYHKKPVISPDNLLKLKEIAPLILICGDASDRRQWDLLEIYNQKQCFHLMVNIDGSFDTPVNSYKNGLTLLTPIDHTLFNPKPWNDRNINFGMVARCYSEDRLKIIESAKECGLEFYSGDGYRPYTTMANIMCDTKVTLNIAQAVEGHEWLQVKGRVVEAGFAGCVLFETEGSPTNKWFIPGTDYIEYDDPRDLVYDDLELLEMSIRFRTKMVQNHNSTVFWSKALLNCEILAQP